MTTNAAIGWENNILTGTLTAGSASVAAPVANLLNAVGATPWRTAGILASASGAWIQVDMAAATTWRMFGVFRTNLTTAATVRWMLGSTAGGSDVYDSTALSGLVAGYGQVVLDAGANYSARYLRVEFEDSANPDGSISIGLAYAGASFIPSNGIRLQWPSWREDLNRGVETKGGQKYIEQGAQRRVQGFDFPAITEAEAYASVHELDRISRQNRNVMIMPRPGSGYENREAVFGLIRSIGRVQYEDWQHFTWQFEIEERL